MKVLCLLVILSLAANTRADVISDVFDIVTGTLSSVAPTTVDDSEVSFYLATRANPVPTLLTNANVASVDTSKPVKYIVHGWTENRFRQWYQDITTAYLTRYDCNVIQVDWSGPASDSYPVAAQNTRGVGKIIANHIVVLNYNLDKVHLVGHSLGGQAVAFAGKQITVLTAHKVARISGLDPAGPLFLGSPPSQHLFKTDAKFVDVTHTDAGLFGYLLPECSIDFYPNGGTSVQPGCPIVPPITSIADITNEVLDNLFCSHHQSYVLFIQSINSPLYTARRCAIYELYLANLCFDSNTAIYGESVSTTVNPGPYFFTTV